MALKSSDSPTAVHRPAQFATTHWSVVRRAGVNGTPESREALETLCRTYWYPLYVYIRRRDHSSEDAQDLTQQFFALLLKHDYFRLADPKRGRLRTFLLRALENFLTNEWHRARRLKRGGGATILPFNLESGEERYGRESATHLPPDRAYERQWAMTLLDQVLGALKAEYASSGNLRVFVELADLLWGKESSVSFAQIGRRLGVTEGAARGAMHRLRMRYRDRLRLEVAQTVAEPVEVDEELRHLISVISQPG
jgi:RNA polymerase sigma factor (sigma-70 family)